VSSPYAVEAPRPTGFRPPSVPAAVFAVLALVIPTSLGPRLLNADGDVARHLRHGLTMLEQGALLTRDQFSYTRAGEPFLAFEYGSQLLYAMAHQAGGLAAVALLAAVVIAAAHALVARWLLRQGVAPVAAAAVAFGSAILGANQWIARPHVFTVLFAVLLIELLERADRPFWPLFGLFAVWANVHGGWIFGWVLVAAWTGGALLGRLRQRTDGRRRRLPQLVIGAAGAIAGTFLTPHGWRLHQHVLGFFGERYIIANTAEFQRPSGFFATLLVIALVAALAAVVRGRRQIRLEHLAVIAVTAAFAVLAERNAILFAVTGFPLAAAAGLSMKEPRRSPATSTLGYAAATLLVVVFLAVLRGRVGDRQVVPSGFDPDRFPVAAVAAAREAGLRGRIFHEFTWGGYLLYAWPEQRVFIDGGTDFYGPELMRESSEIKALLPGWQDQLSRWGVELVLMRPGAPLATALRAEPGWKVWHSSESSILLVYRSHGAVTPADRGRGHPLQ
jgi:hypothetical protein